MPLFGRETDPVAQELLEEIRGLARQVAKLQGEKDHLSERRTLHEEVSALKREIETLTIEKDRREEEFARERRELEHATGLHRKQTEWERTKAVEEATLAVEKGNLEHERQMFSDQIKFHKEQIKTEVDRLENVMAGLMERLPKVTVEKALDFDFAVGNGRSKERTDAAG